MNHFPLREIHFHVVAYSHPNYAKLTMANNATTVAGRWRRLLLLGFDDIADVLWVIFVVKFMLIDLFIIGLFPRVLPRFLRSKSLQNRFIWLFLLIIFH